MSQMPKPELTPASDGKMLVVYDGDCPFCRSYVGLMELRRAVGHVELVDARTDAPIVRKLAELGYDLDQGMAVVYGGRVYHGKDAVVVMSSISGRRKWPARVLARLLRNPRRAAILYPLMKFGRRVTLKGLGRAPLNVPANPPLS